VTDGELVRRARAGESAAYGQLAQRWAARVLSVCHARVGRAGRAAAEDLAQEALLRGLRSLSNLGDPEKFGPWLIGIAVRTCLDWLKSAQRSEVSLEALGQDENSSAAADVVDRREPGDRRERAEQLMREVERLPQPYREVLMFYYYHDCTYRDAADALGVSAATVNARLTKARAMLRSRMMAQQE